MCVLRESESASVRLGLVVCVCVCVCVCVGHASAAVKQLVYHIVFCVLSKLICRVCELCVADACCVLAREVCVCVCVFFTDA